MSNLGAAIVLAAGFGKRMKSSTPKVLHPICGMPILGHVLETVEEIAQWASVSKPVIYEHFGSKDGLYAVILDRETRELLDTVTSHLKPGHPRTMLEQAVYAFFTYIDEHPDGYRVLLKVTVSRSSLVSRSRITAYKQSGVVTLICAYQFYE